METQPQPKRSLEAAVANYVSDEAMLADRERFAARRAKREEELNRTTR